MCEFGAFLEEALRDKFVCGLRSEGMQKRLLTEPDLAVGRALEIARGMEKAALETKEFKGQQGNSKILSASKPPFQSRGSSNSTTSCFRCGKNDHEG
jgi:hypothetical protein